MLALQNFQQRLFARYKQSLSLPPTYTYLYGNPVQPLVPLEARRQGVCIIGAHPPARLAKVGAEQDVPVDDICVPFPAHPYFDGSRARGMAALEQNYLRPLGLSRAECWLTYLVKLFLFHDADLAKYRRLGVAWPERETHSQFEALARQSLRWLAEELTLARPRLIITLGAEVAGVLQDVRCPEAWPDLLDGNIQDVWLEEEVYPAIHLAGPEHLPAARRVVEQLKRNSVH
jgi:hypothetical protein